MANDDNRDDDADVFRLIGDNSALYDHELAQEPQCKLLLKDAPDKSEAFATPCD